ncbi:hypothetical protein BJ912DRAFT_996213 [Pholiota molesta]|nr:hypothetical protein BJ912DRAFT_996213 [Pholiota molesta]
MASQSTRLPSAVYSLPHDVLTEIFPHCLPRSPIDTHQPNPRVAPMLLCHVCSSWRATTIATPSLWSYLYLRLPIQWDKDGLGPTVWDVKIFGKKIQCLKWWKENQGARAPFVRFEFDRPDGWYHPDWYHPMRPNIMKFVIEYLSSAQYLDVSLFLRYLSKQDRDYGYNMECPHLHTLVVKFPTYGDDDDDDEDHSYASSHSNDDSDDEILPPLTLTHIPPTLRRFSMLRGGGLPRDYNNDWSTLTHLSLKTIFLSSLNWSSLIRGVSRLQWGNFTILLLGIFPIAPPPSTLPFLSTLSMDVDNIDDEFVDIPLTILFLNLKLPALETLSLCSNSRQAWSSPYAIKEVNAVLRSAPAISKLALGPKFLSSAYTHTSIFEEVWKNESPLSVLAPRLNHLELDFCCSDEDDNTKLSQYVAHWKELFFSTNWLDFSNPTNTVRTMSIFVKSNASRGPLAFPIRMRDKVSAIIEEYVRKADDVAFRIFLVDKRETLPDGWQTWDSHLSE